MQLVDRCFASSLRRPPPPPLPHLSKRIGFPKERSDQVVRVRPQRKNALWRETFQVQILWEDIQLVWYLNSSGILTKHMITLDITVY